MIQDINNKAFNNFTNGFSVPVGFVTKKNPPVNITPSQNSTSENQNTLNPENKQKMPLGKKVLYSVLALGTVLLLLTKGLPFVGKKFGKWANNLEDKLLMNASENRFAHYVDSGITNTSKLIKRMFSISNSAANFTTLKDTGFKKLYSLNFLKFKNPEAKMFPRLAKAWNWILNLPTRFFNFATKNILKITESAIDTRYSNVAKKLDRSIAKGVQMVEKSGASPADKAEAINLMKDLNTIYTDGFSKTSRNARLNELDKGLSNVPDKVSEAIASPFCAFSTKRKLPFFTRLKLFVRRFRQNYSSYITMKQSKTAKLKHQDAVTKARIAFSNDIQDTTKTIQNLANELKHSLSTDDLESRRMFGGILRKIKEYGKIPEKDRAKLQNEITEGLKELFNRVNTLEHAGKKVYSKQEIQSIRNIAGSMRQTMYEYSTHKGALQKLDEKMKEILPAQDYEKWREQILQPLHKEFSTAVDAEMGNMFDKWAEAKVGSIPTDIVFQAAAIGGGAYHIAKEDDKKERIGASLKAGMPIIGGIATYFYSASKAFSGTTNLALTALSGYILNRIGDSIFKYYQKRFIEKKAVKEIAKEAVNDAVKS